MKELKFRVWDKENEYLIVSMNIYELAGMLLTKCYYNLYAEFPITLGEHIILPYTGFKDKNNKDIFVYDILEVAGGTKIIVNDMSEFLVFCGKYEEKHGVPLFPSVQVVGTQYEKSE